MSFLVIDINEVRDLLWIDGEICGFEELFLRKMKMEVDCEIVALARAESEGGELLRLKDLGVFGGSGCPITASWLTIQTCQAVDPYFPIGTCRLFVLYA